MSKTEVNTETDQDSGESVVSERTYDWLDQTHEVTRPDMPDEEVARRVRMVTRSDLDLEFVCVLGRDRIMALVKEKRELDAQVERLSQAARFAITEMDTVLSQPSSPSDDGGMVVTMMDARNELLEAMSSH